MSSLEWRLRRLEERASASSPGDGGSAAHRKLARKFENAIVAAGAGEGPELFDPEALGRQSPVGMAARIVALAVEAHPAEREARRVLAGNAGGPWACERRPGGARGGLHQRDAP